MNQTMKTFVRRRLPAAVKPHRILAGPLRGMRMVTSWHDYPAGITGRTERPLLEWFAAQARAGETWLDVGAHYGYTSLALARLVGPTGRVFSFEPFVASAGHLCSTRKLNGLDQMRVVPVALGQHAQFAVHRMVEVRGMLDSTLAPNGNVEMYFEAALDWIWPSLSEGNPRIDGIKIDVQGMEIRVIEGMREILARWGPKLALEFHGGVDRQAILALLEDAGYRLPGAPIEPVDGEHTRPQYLDDRSYAFEIIR
jgi:FkbM family methyltransferase